MTAQDPSSYPPKETPHEILSRNKPTDILRVERDYASGEGVVQFWSGYPVELEDRVRLLLPGETVLRLRRSARRNGASSSMISMRFWRARMIRGRVYWIIRSGS